MPFLFWLDSGVYLLSVILSMAICLTVLGADPGKRINQFFALFVFLSGCWAFFSLLIRMTMWLQLGDWNLHGELATFAFTLMGPGLLLFATRYVGKRKLVWDIIAGLVFVLCFAMLPLLVGGQVIQAHYFHPSGATHLRLTMLGIILSFLPLLLFVVVLLLFWRERKNIKEKLLPYSVLFLLGGLILGGVIDIGIPVMSFTTLICVSMLGYAVLRRQLFNPLKERNIELQHEIAERLRTETALRESEMNVKALIEAVPDAIFQLDGAGMILDSSHPEIVCEDSGRATGAGIPVETLFPGKTGAELGRRIEHARQSGGIELYEFYTEEGRSKRYFEARIVRVRENNVLLMVRDVSRKKELEAQASQSNKMEAIGRLAGGVAHDFNNVLTVILNLADLGLREPDAAVIASYLGEIKKSSLRAADLTRGLLAFSRKQLLIPKIVDLNRIIEDLEPMLKRLVGEDISITLSLDARAHLVRVDPGQIQQVLMNLAANARDALPRGGVIGLATGCVTVGAENPDGRGLKPGSYTRVVFRDSGVGIEREILPQIFEPFFTTKKEGKGTGLGLATVHGIVTQSSGHILVESENGQGTRFEIFFPIAPREDGTEPDVLDIAIADEAALTPAPVEKKEESQNPGSVPPGQGAVVLLVEDEVFIRDPCRKILEDAGYSVIPCADSECALSIIGDSSVRLDFLLTDVVMPGGTDGFELAARMRDARADAVVILMSGYANDFIRKYGTLPDGVGFLEKPFDRQRLLEKLSRFTSRG